MLSFSQLLDKYIRESGLSNSLLAWNIGDIAHQSIKRWRTCEVKPNCEKVRQIAKALKLSLKQQNELLLAAGCKPQESIRPITGKPITHPYPFFGREKILNRISLAWRNPSSLEHVAIIGPKSSGKTSLLNYLQHINQTPLTELRLDQPQGWNGWLPHGFQFVRVDFREPMLCQLEHLLSHILQQITTTPITSCDFLHFVELIKQVEQPTVILMDEIGIALEAPSLTPEFWNGMRFLGSTCGKLGFLVTAHELLEKLALDRNRASSFFNLFGHVLEIGPFTEAEAKTLIDYFPHPITPEDTQWLLDESQCWPALLQKMCEKRLLTLKISLMADSNHHFLSLPLVELPKFKQDLEDRKQLYTVLKNMDVPKIWLEEAIKFIKTSNPERCAIFANRVGTTYTTTSELEVFKLQLKENFPLNLTHCLLYFPPENLSLQELEMRSKQGEMAFQVTIVISLNSEQQTALRPCGENPLTQCVVPNSQELTQLLLAPDPIKVFATLLASQLKITQISPYQVSEGVNKDITFFGRFQILAHIMNREPANYLLMGGRQIGKSSILKHIERHYKNHPKIDCHYLVLSGASLQAKLAKALCLPLKTDLETLLEALANVPEGQYRLILIDEADLFVREEMQNGYPTLNHFRSLSEEGHCYFIFAGFWDLYDAALLDYHSPIKNFGEPIIIGALEAEACQQLATQPMAMLGIQYADKHLVEDILIKTGQRANLIAIVCDEMLKNLDKQQHKLDQQDVTRALQSQAVQGALVGWRRLSGDEDAARLDRIIVCATITQGEFTLTDVMTILDQHHYIYTTEQLNQSLARLELAFIIQRHNLCYHYCVPLFQEILRDQDVKALLTQEFKTTPQ